MSKALSEKKSYRELSYSYTIRLEELKRVAENVDEDVMDSAFKAEFSEALDNLKLSVEAIAKSAHLDGLQLIADIKN